MSSTREASGGADPPPPATWSDVLTSTHDSKYARNLFPPLTPAAHKGSHGRVAILGGSDKYTGAPYYAAQSALHCGVDLATVFTAKEAAVPIKCYSPELMVQSVYSIEELDGLAKEEEGLLAKLEECKQTNDVMTHEVHERELQKTLEKLEHSEERQQLLVQNELKRDDKMEVLAERLGKMQQIEGELGELRDRQDVAVQRSVDAVAAMFPSLHALCVGPGLGRHPLVFRVAAKVLRRAIESNLTLVLDADALYMLSLREYRPLLEELRGYDRCVMTPNAMEMRRLDDALDLDTAGGANSIIVRKGHVDAIVQGAQAMHCEEEGGLKRSGGIGDVLAGTLSAFLAWNAILERKDDSMDEESKQQRAFAAWASCCAVKMATKAAYRKKRRAMSAMHVLEEMGGVLEGMEGGLEASREQALEQPAAAQARNSKALGTKGRPGRHEHCT